MAVVNVPVPAEAAEEIVKVVEDFIIAVIVPDARGLQLVVGSGTEKLVEMADVHPAEEVHAVPGAVVQRDAPVGLLPLPLMIAGAEVAAPSLASAPDGLQLNDRCNLRTVFRSGIGDDLCCQNLVRAQTLKFCLVAYLFIVDVDDGFPMAGYGAVAHHQWQMSNHLRGGTEQLQCSTLYVCYQVVA